MATGAFSIRSGTRIGNFNIPLSFTEAVSGVGVSNLNAVAVDGNGITGVVFAVSGSGASYNIAVTLPDDRTGRFRLSLQGTVTPVGSGITEALTGNEITIAYDTASVVMASWGELEYREGGEIVLPVVFAEDIAYLHKTDFTLSRVAGDEVWEVIEDYWLVERVGVARTFYLHFKIAPNKRGQFSVDLTGYVWKTATVVRDDVRIDPITVAYATIEPEIVDERVKRTTVDDNHDRIDWIIQWNVHCTINDPREEFGDLQAQFADFLDYQGEDLDPPNFYRLVGVDGDFPEVPLPDDLPSTDWTDQNLITEEATIYLLRWGRVLKGTDVNVKIKAPLVRGPTH